MPVDFTFQGQTLMLATEAEFRQAVMLGRCISREKGLFIYEYRGRHYLLSDNDLSSLTSAKSDEE